MPQLDGFEPISILLQHLEICKMMNHIPVSFKKAGSNIGPLVINEPNSKPDGTARLTPFPGRFIVLYVVVDNLLGSTVAPNVPSAFATLVLKKNIYPKIVLEALGHSNITITIGLYSHILPNMQHEWAGAVANILKR